MMRKTFAVPGVIALDDLLAGFPHATACLDEGFKIVAVNHLFEAMTGYGRDIAVGVYADFIVRSNMGNNRGQIFQKVADSGETITIDGDIINRSRKKMPVRFTVSLLHTKRGGRSKGLLLVLEDISAQQTTAQVDALWRCDLPISSATARRCRRFSTSCRLCRIPRPRSS